MGKQEKLGGSSVKMSKKAKEREGYDAYSGMFWVEDPLTEEEYAEAAANGIKYATAWERRHRSGWPKERVISEPLGKSSYVKGYRK
jgi:hypothetical protein